MIYRKEYDKDRFELTADGRLARKDKPEKTYKRVICLKKHVDNFIEVENKDEDENPKTE